ncbi:MAG: ROK family transcriptional regulator [Lentimicrobium sp.]|jgi:glucokinase-like ROK family protein|nr:ROK family transcriptional regulator [Lentimicrobium sp.]
MKGINLLFDHSIAKNKISQSQYKKLQLKLILLRELYYNAPMSIHDLTQATKMSTPTITRAVDELMAEGWITDHGIGESTGGRPPWMCGLNPSSWYMIGIDLERAYIKMAVFDMHNQPVNEIHELNEGLDDTEDVIDFIANKVDELLTAYNIDKKKVLGIGLSLPGLIDIRTGLSYTYLNSGIPPADLLWQKTGLPVFIEQDTRAMAWGEQAFGLAQDHQNVLCLNVGSGIGLSLILNGKIFKGHSGYAGEFGHIQLVPNGRLCHCGKIGCIETVASGKVMINRAREEIDSGTDSIMQQLVQNNLKKINLKTILKAAELNDQYAINLLSDAGDALGKGISTLIHLFDPELIIIGGELSKASDLLIPPIERNLNIYAISRIRRDARIVSSELGDNAKLLGTLAMTMHKIFYEHEEANVQNI